MSLLAFVLLSACHDPSEGPETKGPGRPDLVVVVLDAARADHFGPYGYESATPPRADAFAERATRYQHVRSEAAYTFLSTSALFTGASPAETGLGARSGGRVPESMELLAERARAAGYRTFGYSENPYVTPYFGLAQGFEYFDEAYPTEDLRAGREPATKIDSSARIAALLEAATAEDDRPFFFYAHLLRPHNPYQPPTVWPQRFGARPEDQRLGSTEALLALSRRGPPFEPALIARLITLYDANLSYGDALFGELLDRLEAAGRLDDAVVVLTADHGEGFGEEGALLHSTRLDDARLRVPLLIRGRGVEAGVVEAPIQLADLGQGLRRVMEGEAPGLLARLDTLRDPARPPVSWTNAATGQLAAWRDGRRVVLDARSGEVVVYDEASRDGGSAPDVLDARSGEVVRYDEASRDGGSASGELDAAGRALAVVLEEQLARWTGRSEAVEEDGPLDPVRRRQLEALGYIDP